MKPDEMKELAQLLQKVPGLRGIEFKEVKRLAELLQEAPEIGSIELKGLFGTGVVITRTGGGRWGRGGAGGAGAGPGAQGDQVPDGGDVLRGARAGGRAVPEGRIPGFAGADRVHHRGDEDHERDRGGIRRRAARSLCGGRPAG